MVNYKFKLTDTIAAISSAHSDGAIGIIRLSGDEAFSILKKIFQPKSKNTSKASQAKLMFGNIKIAQKVVDQALIANFYHPKSYTGEDMVEIYAHGNFALLNLILRHILSLGARLAEPGEFTRRAFLNDKIDLTKAEAIAEMMEVSSLMGAQVVSAQLEGRLQGEVIKFKNELKSVLAILNAGIDFSDEDLDFEQKDKLIKRLEVVNGQIGVLLKNAPSSIIMHHGGKVVIGGLVNVGKSSLLNALLGKDKSIVTNIAGTTRDMVGDYLLIDGLKLEILDTAGLRRLNGEAKLATSTIDEVGVDEVDEVDEVGEVEEIGIKKSFAGFKKADVILWVVDLTKPLFDIPASIKDKKILLVGNKLDLLGDKNFDFPKSVNNLPKIKVSALKNIGLESLKGQLKNLVLGQEKLKPENAHIFNSRQQGALQTAKKHLTLAIDKLKFIANEDTSAYELTLALDSLAAVVGQVTNEDVLGEIFAKFCIGK
ncbi:MAG: tRNA uridine-5-carboxymethylaminomethyl(34) synthesis GTPase MnmE [SAR324 cluster bacterium]|nr:tRNA uridine-5-carboxymethylaminomethyl(34) synthesis GTPase MnmE [SAR324 cluster bacterium]